MGLLVVLAIPAFIFRFVRHNETATNPVKSRQASAPMPVKVYPVKVTTITEEIGASAEVQSSSFAHIASTLSGTKVKAVHVDVGDYVEEGQILFELDRTLLTHALKSAEDQVNMTKAKLEEVTQTQKTLHEELEAAVKSAEATVEKTRAKLEEVEKTQPTQHEELLANLKKAQDEVESNKAKLEQTKKTQPTRHEEWVAQLESSKASVISNKSSVQVSEAALARQKNLTGQSIVSQSTLEQAQNALDIARSNYVKSLQDQVVAQNNLKNEEITNKAELGAAQSSYSTSLYDLKTVENSLKNEQLTNASELTQAGSDYTSALEALIKAQNALENEEVNNKAELSAAESSYSTSLYNLKIVENSLKNEELTNNSSLTQARSDYVSALESLIKAQHALQNELVTSQADLTSAISSYTSALQTLAKAQYDLDNATVRSPIVGVITERNVNPGEIIGATVGSSLLVIGNIQPVMVVADVAEEKLTSVHLGQTAKLTLDSLPNEVLEGSIVKIDPNVNKETRTFQAYIRVDNPNRVLRPGLSAFVRIQNSRIAPTVPKVAIVDSAGKSSAFVVDSDSIARLRYVKVGLAGDGLVEVLNGINEGENVVTIGQTMLKDGDKVRISPEENLRKLFIKENGYTN